MLIHIKISKHKGVMFSSVRKLKGIKIDSRYYYNVNILGSIERLSKKVKGESLWNMVSNFRRTKNNQK